MNDKKSPSTAEKAKLDIETRRKDLFVNSIKKDIDHINEAQLKDKLEKKKLLLKFFDSENNVKETSNIRKSIDIIKSINDRKNLNRVIQEPNDVHVDEDHVGISEKSLPELTELVIPNEKDMELLLEEFGFKHLVKKKV